LRELKNKFWVSNPFCFLFFFFLGGEHERDNGNDNLREKIEKKNQ
jgi:hypothetical protein